MDSKTLSFAVFCAALAVVSSQQSTPNVLPPNCACPTQSPMMASSQSASMGQNGPKGMRGMHQICGSDGQNYTSKCAFVNAQANNQALGTKPCRTIRPMGMNGMGNNGNNMGNNGNNVGPSTGNMSNNMGSMGNNMNNGNNGQMPSGQNFGRGQGGSGGRRQITVCMTDGTSKSGSPRSVNQIFLQNPAIGIRCRQACPCPALTCPGRSGWGG